MNNEFYQPTEVPVSVTPPKPKILPLSNGKKTLAFFLLISCILCIDFGLFGGFNAGYTITMWATTVLYLIFAGKGKNTVYSWGCIILSLASTVIFAVYQDGLIRFTLFNLFFLMMSAALCDRYEIGKYSTGTFRSIADTVVLIAAYPFLSMGKAMKALFVREQNGVIRNKGVLLGLVCALPVIAIVLPLLISADAAFEKMFGFLKELQPARIIFAVIFGTVLFVLLYCHAYGAGQRIYAREPRNDVQRHALPTAALMSFSGAVSLVYVLYIISQLTYFFSAFTGKTPADFLPAAYARRGFFEMCVICVINLALMFGVLLCSGRYKGKIQKPIAAVCTFMSLFSLLLIVTAQSKMYLYITRFGLTRLRLLTSVFMIFLGAVFILLILRLFITRLPYMRPLILIAALITILVGLADVDATIARYNVEAYQSGKLSTVDVEELKSLNDSAIPHIIPLLDDKNDAVRTETRLYLDARRTHLKAKFDKDFDFRSFNYSEYKALRALNDNVKKLASNN